MTGDALTRTSAESWRGRAFGLTIAAAAPLPGIADANAGDGEADLSVELVGDELVEATWSGTAEPPVWASRLGDGCIVEMLVGQQRDVLIVYGDRGRLHLTADGRRLLCAGAPEHERARLRFLLDTGLFTAFLLQDGDILHAAAVELPAGVVALAGSSGAGKSTLTLELLRRGRPLFCDDVLALRRDGDRIVAHPAPAVMNVPAERRDAVADGSLLATFAEERELWMAVGTASRDARQLAALFLLDRTAEGPARAERLAPNPIELLGHRFGLPHLTERRARSFELFADLVDTVPLFALRASAEATPAQLADAVEHAVAA